MSSISDGSTDPLLARFKVLEETVDKLHRENRSLKTKVQSYNTLSTFYHEARQQNKNLNKQLAEKEALIQQLRTGQKTFTAAAAEHHVEPPPSLIEGLMEELNRIRSEHNKTEKIYQEQVENLNQENQKLHKVLEERDHDIEKVSSWPQQEKDMELLRLQRSLAEKERVQATSEVLCRSLSDETHQLRRKLASTAEMCQQLVKCLEETRQKDNLNTEERLIQNQNDNDAALRKLQEENRLLKQKVVHVEDLNAKWQKYDASREDYVKGLHQQLKEMKGQSDHPKTSHTTHKHPDLLQKEICRLNRLLEDKIKENTKLQQEASEMVHARIADRERIQMLEQQLLVYKDDFTSERADRERAQSRIQELVDEISALQRHGRRPDDRESAVKRNKTHVKKNVGDPQLGLNVEPAENRRQTSPAGRPDHQRSPSSEHRGQDELQCPRCLRVFQDRLGENFLEHISECCQ